jgi:hypothetical protein
MKPTMPIPVDQAHPDFGGWSRQKRTSASMAIIVGLFVVIMGPVTNPIATEELTGPIGKLMAPVHQTFYLGHGYRFFAPDPSPSHLLVYKLHQPDGSITEHQFPDTQVNWPRLLYHRWFMLSETIYEEHVAQPDRESFARMQTDLAKGIERFQNAGKTDVVHSLQRSRDRQQKIYDRSDKRIRELVQAVGAVLLSRSKATKVELFCRERMIPLPADVIIGQKLNDPVGLSPPSKIGEVSAVELVESQKEQNLP